MSNIKQCFVSRWGDDGYVVEGDLSQIEVAVQAVLSQDQNMIQDIINGIDFHCKRLAYTLKEPYEKVLAICKDETHIHFIVYDGKRTKAKVFSFQKALIN